MAANCLFCDMASGAVPVSKLHEDELVFAIRDINPRAPVHVLIIPRRHIDDARQIADGDGPLLTRMLEVAARVAEHEGIRNRGYRLAFNVGEDGGMTIPHLHMHVVGGRHLGAEG